MIIEPIINSHKIKYSILGKLVAENFTKGNRIQIFINLDSILNSFYKPLIMEGICDFKKFDNIILSSEIINIIAHYRHYFWSYYKVPSVFYLYYLNTIPIRNKEIYDDYCKKSLKKKSISGEYGTINNAIRNNLKLVKLVCDYIQEAYFITNDGLEPSLIPYHIIKKTSKNKNITNLILTKDEYDYQLVNLNDNTFVLRLKYDDSFIIKQSNLYEPYFKNHKYRPKIDISPDLYTSILSFAGVKSRSIKTFKGFGFINTMRYIEKEIINNNISNCYHSKLNKITEIICSNEEQRVFINNLFNAIDLKRQHKEIPNIYLKYINKQIVNKFDNASLMDINTNYYGVNPLQLIELCEGVNYHAKNFFI